MKHDGRVADALRGDLRRRLKPECPGLERGPISFDDVELWRLPNAGAFSKDVSLETLPLIQEFRRQPASQLLADLCGEGSADGALLTMPRRGRPPIPGDWTALYLAYVASGDVVISDFQRRLESGHERTLLEECGFTQVPARQTVDLRFAALESHYDAFTEVAGELVRLAKKTDPKIGAFAFVDCTAVPSASALDHACVDRVWCRDNSKGRMPGIAGAAEISELHYAESDDFEPDIEAVADELALTRGELIERETAVGPVLYREIFIKGHRYLTRDLESGVRWYSNVWKFWHGGYDLTAVDMYTGLGLAKVVFPNDVAEWDGYPSLCDALDATGSIPRVISVDKGFVNNPFFEFNARRGIGVVAPFRARKENETRSNRRTDFYDEHGAPRCQYCGGPGDRLTPPFGPTLDRTGEPYIRFRCLVPRTIDCRRIQRIACALDWVQLGLLSPELGVYHDVASARSNKEGSFAYDRRRYSLVGLKGERAFRTGMDVYRLRSAASLLLNWFRFCLRQGSLTPVVCQTEQNNSEPILLSENGSPGIGAERLHELLKARDEANLDLPYGEASDRLLLAYGNR